MLDLPYRRLDDRDEFRCDRCRKYKKGGWDIEGEEICHDCHVKHKEVDSICEALGLGID